MKQWWLIVVLLLSLGVNIGLLAGRALQGRAESDGPPAIGEAPPPESDPLPRRVYRLADELDLRGEKRDAFVANQRAFFEQTLAARGRMERLRRELRRGVTAEDPDREALDALLVQVAEAHYDLERAFVTNLIDTRELLDEHQEKLFMRFLGRSRQIRAEAERRFRERWNRMGERWDQRGPRGRGPGRFGSGRFGPQRPGAGRPGPPDPPPEPPENGERADPPADR